MISPEAMILTLVVAIAYQQWFYSRQIQKLVDKLMSRNYADYQHAQTPTAPVVRIPTEAEPPEDLRTLQEFQLTL